MTEYNVLFMFSNMANIKIYLIITKFLNMLNIVMKLLKEL